MRELVTLALVFLWCVGLVKAFMLHWILGLLAVLIPPLAIFVGAVGLLFL